MGALGTSQEVRTATLAGQKRRKKKQEKHLPRVALIISSTQPNENASILLRVALQSILEQSYPNLEIWVVDTGSKKAAHLIGSREFPGVTFIYRRRPPMVKRWDAIPGVSRAKKVWNLRSANSQGSYANGFGLGLGIQSAVLAKIAAPEFFMTLQMDVMFTSPDAVATLLSKFDSNTAAVGVRAQLNYNRTEEILHSLGCVWRTSAFQATGANMLPSFPSFDVGERAVSVAKQLGMDTLSLRNTFSDTSVEKTITEPLFRHLPVDRTLDENNKVIFLHLGRGVPRASGKVSKSLGIKDWETVWKTVSTTRN